MLRIVPPAVCPEVLRVVACECLQRVFLSLCGGLAMSQGKLRDRESRTFTHSWALFYLCNRNSLRSYLRRPTDPCKHRQSGAPRSSCSPWQWGKRQSGAPCMPCPEEQQKSPVLTVVPWRKRQSLTSSTGAAQDGGISCAHGGTVGKGRAPHGTAQEHRRNGTLPPPRYPFWHPPLPSVFPFFS